MTDNVNAPIEPRIWIIAMTAKRLGMCAATFRKRAADMEGFPKYDPVLKGYDGKAVELWLDERSGIGSASDGFGQSPDEVLDQWLSSLRSK